VLLVGHRPPSTCHTVIFEHLGPVRTHDSADTVAPCQASRPRAARRLARQQRVPWRDNPAGRRYPPPAPGRWHFSIALDRAGSRRIGPIERRPVATIATMPGTLYITGDADADRLLNSDGVALLIGMLLDQQVPMEWAFRGPATLRERLGHLDATRIAAMDPEAFVAVCCDKPAIHRFPAVMGRRIHELCMMLTDRYGGSATNVWTGVDGADALYARLRELPGYGDEKAKIFLALLAKRQGVAPDGWRASAGKFGDDVPRSVADIFDDDSLAKVREWKKAQKAAKKDKQDRPLAEASTTASKPTKARTAKAAASTSASPKRAKAV